MSKRVYNFFPGPCTLPESALEEVHSQCKDFENSGMSLWETSHRTPGYEAIQREAEELMMDVFQIPDTHRVLFLGGGGTLQFAMIPMNFLTPGTFAEHVLTGHWAQKAYNDAKLIGDARIIANNEDKQYTYVPKGYPISKDARYLYVTTNNTFYGSELHEYPETNGVPIIADMSSDILTRPVDWSRIVLTFAGLTKNLGPGGMAVVIVNKKFMEGNNRNIPAYLRYDIHHEHNSLYNTPPMFCIYMMRSVLKWTKEHGGLAQMDKNCDERADMLYKAIDAFPGYYDCPIVKEDRSRTNICWQLPTKELEDKFVQEAKERGMVGLAGHFMVGHLRASLYNAMSIEGVQALVQFMEEFHDKNPA